MAGKTFATNDLLTADAINLYLARTYEYAYNGTSTFIPAPEHIWNDFAGQLSLDIEVNSTGVLWVEFGFEGWASLATPNTTSTVWLAPFLTGANTVGPSTTDPFDISVRISALGTKGQRSGSRQLMFTGLTPGVTTITLRGRLSDLTNGTTAGTKPQDENFVDNQWIYAQNYR